MLQNDPDIASRWTRSDLTVQPDPVLYLDTVHAIEFAKNYKRRTFEALRLRPGDQILETGCGTGEDALALAELVGPSGKVTGVDINPAMLIEGTKRNKNSRLPVVFQHGDACRLQFSDNSFDGCRSDRAVQHMEDPAKAVSEMARVVRPGRRVVISEPDWATLVIDGADPGVSKRIVDHISERGARHALVGRRLYALFQKAGLEHVEARGDTFIIYSFELANRVWGLSRHAAQAREASTISGTEMDDWLLDLHNAARAGQFFSAIVGFMVCGDKPSAPSEATTNPVVSGRTSP